MFADKSEACKNTKTLRQKGSIIFPLVIAVGVAVASLSVYFNQMALIRKLDTNRLMVAAALKAHVASIQALLYSQKAMMKTLKSSLNGELWNCMNNVEYACAQLTPTGLSLISETGNDTNPFVDKTAGRGLTATLQPCSGYPSVSCPFRYELTWHAECALLTPSCNSPDIFIDGQLLIAPNVVGVVALNPTHYTISWKVR